ncbi:hypothetical protein G5B38_19240 (plasmid) [Pseudohalocynthiibacter aestuariivivens]|nr:alginate lyase family protein [Pseudohalocynthiibacter aestuariivivens]QIE47758.1 hypothetical protein G5B38_19240 [Pseudohalocynthiibacter aestuariivivens]
MQRSHGFYFTCTLKSVVCAAIASMFFDASPTYAGSGILRAEVISANARQNRKFCNTHWDGGWLGPISSVRSYPAIKISGSDLAGYQSNADPVINLLHYFNVNAALNGKIEPLKGFVLQMAQHRQFSKLSVYRPKTWHGKVPSWLSSYNGLAEPAYSAALLLVPISHSYVLLEPYLTSEEKKLIRQWGSAIYKMSKNANDGTSGKARAYDRKAAKAAGFVSWGAASGDRSAYRDGVSLFRSVVRHISRDGSDDFFTVGGHEGYELKYLNMTYGHLSIAAGVMESVGDSGFGYRQGGGSLADGLNFLITQSFSASARTSISPKQNELRFASRSRQVTDSTWSFLEFAERSAAAQTTIPGLKRALGVRGAKGFYGGHHGGYTSCLF